MGIFPCSPKLLEGLNKILLEDKIENLVCVEVLRPSQNTGIMSSAVSLPNHTFTGQA